MDLERTYRAHLSNGHHEMIVELRFSRPPTSMPWGAHIENLRGIKLNGDIEVTLLEEECAGWIAKAAMQHFADGQLALAGAASAVPPKLHRSASRGSIA